MMEHWLTINWNTTWSSILIQAFVDHGLTTYFVSPGYRNAPFIAALRQRSDLELVSCPDERAAAYQALGYAKAAEKPAILLSTSGTAGANYYPAVIEAFKEQLPLLIITTDRPFELQFTAANQTIKQPGLFQGFVKQELNLPEPNATVKPQVLLDGMDRICRAMATFPWGVCHINLPFRSPLEPVAQDDLETAKLTAYLELLKPILARRRPKAAYQRRTLDLASLTDYHRQALSAAKSPLLLVGRLNHGSDIEAVKRLLPQLQIPFYCDIGSSLKAYCVDKEISDPAHPAVREWLLEYQADLVIHIGQRLVTKYFDEFFAQFPPREFWSISSSEDWLDPAHVGAEHLQVDIAQFMAATAEHWPSLVGPKREKWSQLISYLQAEQQEFDQYSKQPEDEEQTVSWPEIAQGLLQGLPPQTSLLIGNSRAIRVFDKLRDSSLASHRVFANRGASGIEGLVATGLGIARAQRTAVCLVLGDISLIHDLNSVLALKHSPYPVLIVVVNDGGGTIFKALPIADYPEITDPLMTTPHQFHFEGLAKMAGISYRRVSRKAEWKVLCQSLSLAILKGGLIEIDLTE